MSSLYRVPLCLIASVLLAPGASAQPNAFAPSTYIAHYLDAAPQIDGRLDDAAWVDVAFTDLFVDIEGDRKPRPRFATRAKMAWDDTFFYVAAEMEESHVWATLTQRDAVIFYDNDFEVFIDPDGDTHAYYELELNALATVWDLLLLKPYRDGGPPIDGWDIAGLEVGVHIDGTLNDPTDTDRGWSVELAIPWRMLREAAPERRAPHDGEQWRVNFSRVQWHTDVVDGQYVKRTDPDGKPLPEDNWVWTPQDAINMHRPEWWGYVQFSTSPPGTDVAFVPRADEAVKWALRQFYYRQKAHHATHGRYATTWSELGVPAEEAAGFTLHPHGTRYEIATPFGGRSYYIRHDGKTWVE